LHGVAVRLAGRVGARQDAAILREVPAASRDLPSVALTTEGGGGIAVDPRTRQTPQALLKYFQVELLLPQQPATSLPVGLRAHVRFDHGYEPLAAQAYRRVRQLFLERLGT
jgi:putative peptide zinc metalloprotease protein